MLPVFYHALPVPIATQRFHMSIRHTKQRMRLPYATDRCLRARKNDLLPQFFFFFKNQIFLRRRESRFLPTCGFGSFSCIGFRLFRRPCAPSLFRSLCHFRRLFRLPDGFHLLRPLCHLYHDNAQQKNACCRCGKNTVPEPFLPCFSNRFPLIQRIHQFPHALDPLFLLHRQAPHNRFGHRLADLRPQLLRAL